MEEKITISLNSEVWESVEDVFDIASELIQIRETEDYIYLSGTPKEWVDFFDWVGQDRDLEAEDWVFDANPGSYPLLRGTTALIVYQINNLLAERYPEHFQKTQLENCYVPSPNLSHGLATQEYDPSKDVKICTEKNLTEENVTFLIRSGAWPAVKQVFTQGISQTGTVFEITGKWGKEIGSLYSSDVKISAGVLDWANFFKWLGTDADLTEESSRTLTIWYVEHENRDILLLLGMNAMIMDYIRNQLNKRYPDLFEKVDESRYCLPIPKLSHQKEVEWYNPANDVLVIK